LSLKEGVATDGERCHPRGGGGGPPKSVRAGLLTWAMEQARALRAQRVKELDWKNPAEEVEDLGKSERRELQNRLEVLLAHLLKRQFQAQRGSRSWDATIAVQRVKIRQHLDQNPGLKPSIPTILAQSYEPARIEAASRLAATKRAQPPKSCPWSFELVIDDHFRPE
jgi:Domain of unknown function DUF29